MAVKQKRPIKDTILINAKERGPGPGNYRLPSTLGHMQHDPSRRCQPAYSFGMKLHQSLPEFSPGPVHAINPQVTRTGGDGTPCYSILGRTKLCQPYQTPAPVRYHPEKVHPQREPRAPSYSMSNRTRFRKRDPCAAPNTYTLPPLIGPKQFIRRSYPSYSMTGRPTVGGFEEDLAKTPGPNTYKVCGPNVVRRRGPKYSMGGRTQPPSDTTLRPGPGAHSPEKVALHKSAKCSMGVRHSEFVTLLFSDVD